MAFSALTDSQTLAGGSDDQIIRLWEGQGLNMFRDMVWWVVFSPDGQRIASGSNDQFNLYETGTCIKILEG